jgi:hypothetical protein
MGFLLVSHLRLPLLLRRRLDDHEVLVCFHEGIPNPNSLPARYLLLIVF